MGSAGNPPAPRLPQPATPARDYRTQGHPLASRPGAQGRLRPEHRKRRGSTSLRDGRAVTVSDEVSAERETNCPPVGKPCPCTRTFRCPLSLLRGRPECHDWPSGVGARTCLSSSTRPPWSGLPERTGGMDRAPDCLGDCLEFVVLDAVGQHGVPWCAAATRNDPDGVRFIQ